MPDFDGDADSKGSSRADQIGNLSAWLLDESADQPFLRSSLGRHVSQHHDRTPHSTWMRLYNLQSVNYSNPQCTSPYLR